MKIILLALLCLVSAVHAADLRTVAGDRFRDYTVTKVEPNGLRITHTDGTAFVDFDSLPREMWAQYGWSSEKSAARKVAIAKAAEEQRAQQAAAAKAQQAAIDAADRDARMAEARRAEAVAKQQQAQIAAQSDAPSPEAGGGFSLKHDKDLIWQIVYFAIGLFLLLMPCWLAHKKRSTHQVTALVIVAFVMVCVFLYTGGWLWVAIGAVSWIVGFIMSLGSGAPPVHVHVTHSHSARQTGRNVQ